MKPIFITTLRQRFVGLLIRFVVVVSISGLSTFQATSVQAQSRGISALRDTEIEALIRDYAVPIFKAARVNHNAVGIHIVNDRSFNAFVANGRRLGEIIFGKANSG